MAERVGEKISQTGRFDEVTTKTWRVTFSGAPCTLAKALRTQNIE